MSEQELAAIAVAAAPKAYSGIPLQGRRSWKVPRWLKEAFVAFAAVAIAAVAASKFVQHWGGALERARSEMDGDPLAASAAFAFQLPQRGGGTYDLSKHQGRLVLVNFWATWCQPCRDEEPGLQRLAQAFEPGSFEVVAISVDEGWEPIDKFFSGRAPAYSVALDEGGKVSQRYGTTRFPESYLLDASGNEKLKFVGPRHWDSPEAFALVEQLGGRRRVAGPTKGG